MTFLFMPSIRTHPTLFQSNTIPSEKKLVTEKTYKIKHFLNFVYSQIWWRKLKLCFHNYLYILFSHINLHIISLLLILKESDLFVHQNPFISLVPRSIKTDSFTVRFRTWSQNGTLTAVNRPYLSVISGTVLRHRIRRRISTLIRLLYGYLRIQTDRITAPENTDRIVQPG